MAPLLLVLLQIATFVLIAKAILSWFGAAPGSRLEQVKRSVDRMTEPVLAPVRRVLPRLGGFDLSIWVVLLVINLVLVPVVSSL